MSTQRYSRQIASIPRTKPPKKTPAKWWKDWSWLVAAMTLTAAVVGWVVFYTWWYWTSCAFVPVLDAPALCFIGRGGK